MQRNQLTALSSQNPESSTHPAQFSEPKTWLQSGLGDRDRIFIELMPSDRKLEAHPERARNEGSTRPERDTRCKAYERRINYRAEAECQRVSGHVMFERGGDNMKVVKDFTCKVRSECGLDCLMCAIFPRQGLTIRGTWLQRRWSQFEKLVIYKLSWGKFSSWGKSSSTVYLN